MGALSLSRWQPRAGAARRSSGRPTRLAALPFSTRALARGGPLSAGLQVLVREHVELAVQPTGFIPAEKGILQHSALITGDRVTGQACYAKDA